MNINNAKKILIKNDVPHNWYVFGGLGAGDCVGIEKNQEDWEVYYSERGKKRGVKVFLSENEACLFFLKEIAEGYKIQIKF